MLALKNLGVRVPKVLLPKPEAVDYAKWAVVACDQYTAEPEYWADVQGTVGDAKSTLRIIYPEVFLKESETERKDRIAAIHKSMATYLKDDLFAEHESFVYVEREARHKTRHGIMALIDLEAYDYSKGSTSLVRATEGTIVDRIPPRVEIRAGAPLEAPHILVLIDDREGKVLEPLAGMKDVMQPLYDVELMKDSGHVKGWRVHKEAESDILSALQALSAPDAHAAKYGVDVSKPVLLFAMGDGNHSLATAKFIWESEKEKAGPKRDEVIATSPLRFALVEINNVHDSGIEFEPIHRVMFGVTEDAVWTGLEKHLPGIVRSKVASLDELRRIVAQTTPGVHRFGLVAPSGMYVAEATPTHNIAVGTLQSALDPLVKTEGFCKELDYVHGDETTARLGAQEGNVGFILSAIEKNDLFKTVLENGALPRKTFSMGEADEKRFYMETRLLE